MKKKISLISEKVKKLSFYKRKTFYIILTVIFSLILVADVAIAVLAPEQSRTMGGRVQGEITMPSFESGDGEMTMPSLESEDGEMAMPSFESEDGEMAMPSFESEDGEMTMPGNFGEGNGETIQSATTFLQILKSRWLIVFVIFAILDAISIFMLVRISRKEKKEKNVEEMLELPEPDNALPVQIKKGTKHSHYIWITVLAGMFVLVIIINVMTSQSDTEAAQTEATVYSGTAETGNISSVLPGTGTLADEEAISLELPENVKVTEWYVSDGDLVEAGDKLAQVDKVSVMSAIVTVQEKLTALDEALEEHENDEISDTITAGASGRVKKIYAKKGVDVVETMYESGALMRISLDGMMAVSMEAEVELSAGDSVKVTLSDGSTINGKVESMTSGIIVITMSDEEVDYDEKVTVKTTDGETVGTGKAYIHSELKITGFTGTVSAVKVSEGKKVSSGTKLLILEDTDYAGEYELLLAQRNKLEEQIQKLFSLYQDQYIYADCTGVVASLDEEASKSAGVVGTAYEDDNVKIQMLTTVSEAESEASENENTETEESEDIDTGTSEGETAGTIEGEETSTPDTDSTETETTYDNYTGVVSSVEGNVAIVNLLSVNVSGNTTQECKLALDNSFTVYNYKNGSYIAGKTEDIQVNDVLMLICKGGEENVSPVLCIRILGESDLKTENAGTATEQGESNNNAEVSEQGKTMASTISATTTDVETATMYSQVQEMQEEEIEENYSVTTTTWMDIIPQETMDITITVDELDILSLEKGQKAQVTLDAFPGQSFEGTVTSINLSGSNAGGSSKYTAVVSIERQENMLAGMNASVVITLDTKEEVLMIPEAALVEEDSSVYVYTSYDEKTETFGGLAEVTTGVSDGEYVEILSGLEEGSEYWYSYLDVVNYSTASSGSKSGFSIQSMFGGRSR